MLLLKNLALKDLALKNLALGLFIALMLQVSALTSLLAQELPVQLKGHGGPIKSITASKDGKRVLTASFDYNIIYWDISSEQGKVIHRLIGHDAAVNDVAFLPDETRAVSVSDDGTLGIWDLDKGELIIKIAAPRDKALDVAISPDGSKAAVARWDKTVRIYDLKLQLEIAVLKNHRGNVNSVAFSKDGQFLYSAGGDGQILEWDMTEYKFIRPVYRHGWGINSIAMMDGDQIVFGGLDGTVAIVSPEKADRVKDIAKKERPIQTVKTSPDAALLGFGDVEGNVEVFAADFGKKIEGDQVTYGPVWDLEFIAGTNHIYHVGLDDFATRWQISPRKANQIQAEYPRRFQVRKGDDPGEIEFQRKCSVCHTLVEDGANRAGPTLYKLFGRKAGTLPGYTYSKALLDSEIVWNEESVHRLFSEGPDKVVPGTKMPIQRLKKIERRDELVRFLKEATQ